MAIFSRTVTNRFYVRKTRIFNSGKVLLHFGKRVASARRKYREFVAGGINEGQRDDLLGGGLIRSAGGWSAVRELKRS